MFKQRKAKTVLGRPMSELRSGVTDRALLALSVGAPILVLFVLLDLFVWAAVKAAFGVCFGVACFI